MSDLSANYHFGLPVAASTFAGEIDHSLQVLHVAMALIFTAWTIFFIYCLVRFRAKEGVRADYHGWKAHGLSFVPDALVLIFELVLIFALGLPVWSRVKRDFPEAAVSNLVELRAQQFSWGFHYPGPDGQFGPVTTEKVAVTNPMGMDEENAAAKDDFVAYNVLHVPLGKPTIIYMTSADVIHSFFVPEFRVKQDIVPGMRIPMWFEPTQAGRYEIGCAQLCGSGHYVMRGEVVVDTPEDYQKWWDSVHAAKNAELKTPATSEDWSS